MKLLWWFVSKDSNNNVAIAFEIEDFKEVNDGELSVTFSAVLRATWIEPRLKLTGQKNTYF